MTAHICSGPDLPQPPRPFYAFSRPSRKPDAEDEKLTVIDESVQAAEHDCFLFFEQM